MIIVQVFFGTGFFLCATRHQATRYGRKNGKRRFHEVRQRDRGGMQGVARTGTFCIASSQIPGAAHRAATMARTNPRKTPWHGPSKLLIVRLYDNRIRRI
jgi:hypothetical protein